MYRTYSILYRMSHWIAGMSVAVFRNRVFMLCRCVISSVDVIDLYFHGNSTELHRTCLLFKFKFASTLCSVVGVSNDSYVDIMQVFSVVIKNTFQHNLILGCNLPQQLHLANLKSLAITQHGSEWVWVWNFFFKHGEKLGAEECPLSFYTPLRWSSTRHKTAVARLRVESSSPDVQIGRTFFGCRSPLLGIPLF